MCHFLLYGGDIIDLIQGFFFFFPLNNKNIWFYNKNSCLAVHLDTLTIVKGKKKKKGSFLRKAMTCVNIS